MLVEWFWGFQKVVCLQMVLQPNFGGCHELGVLSFLCFCPFQKSVLQKLLLDMCFTRAWYISFKSAIPTGHFSLEAGLVLRLTNVKNKIRNVERIDFIPVSYKICGRWQGQEVTCCFAVAKHLQTCARRAVVSSNCLFYIFRHVFPYFWRLTDSYLHANFS